MTQEYSFLCHVSCNMSHFPCYTLPTVSYPTPLKTLSRRTVDERVFYTVTAVWHSSGTPVTLKTGHTVTDCLQTITIHLVAV